MKKPYTLLLSVFLAELIVVDILKENNVQIQSWIGNAIGTFLVLLPIEILFFLLGRDERYAEKWRFCSKVIFWFIIVCYLAGGVATLVS